LRSAFTYISRARPRRSGGCGASRARSHLEPPPGPELSPSPRHFAHAWSPAVAASAAATGGGGPVHCRCRAHRLPRRNAKTTALGLPLRGSPQSQAASAPAAPQPCRPGRRPRLRRLLLPLLRQRGLRLLHGVAHGRRFPPPERRVGLLRGAARRPHAAALAGEVHWRDLGWIHLRFSGHAMGAGQGGQEGREACVSRGVG